MNHHMCHECEAECSSRVFQKFPLPLLCVCDSTIRYNESFSEAFIKESHTFSLESLPLFLSQAILFVKDQGLKRYVFHDDSNTQEIILLAQDLNFEGCEATLYALMIGQVDNSKTEGSDSKSVAHHVFLRELELSMQNEIQNCLLSQRRYKQLFCSRKDGIIVLKCHGQDHYEILDANQNILEMLGLEGIADVNFLDLIAHTDREHFKTHISSLAQIEHFIAKVWLIHQASQQAFPVEVFGQVFRYGYEEEIYLMIADISHYITLEKERDYHRALIQQKGKLASMGEMIAVIAHQWRQPLNALSLEVSHLADLYHEDDLSDEDFNLSIDCLHKQIAFMDQTIHDFQSFFMPDKTKEHFFLKPLIEKSYDLLGRYLMIRGNIAISLTEDSTHRQPLYGCSDELLHVMVIIIKNACDAILEYKKNHEDFMGEIKIDIQYDQDHLVLKIKDNGGGIAKEAFSLIFDPYFTTKKDGMGIGLVTAKMIIEDSWKGELRVSNHEHGACFELVLPLEKNVPLMD